MQIWMGAGPAAAGTNQLDTVEAGKRQTSTLAPYLFMYFTNSFYKAPDAGFCTGGYATSANDLAHGWVSKAGTLWPPNTPFANNYSVDPNCGGTSDQCSLSWVDNAGNRHDRILALEWGYSTTSHVWWLYVNNVAVGYFQQTCQVGDPHSGPLVTQTMFHDSTNGRGLLGGGNRGQFYGEVFDHHYNERDASGNLTPHATSTYMGSGTHPVQNAQPSGNTLRGAWFDQMEVYDFTLGWKYYKDWLAPKTKGLGAVEDSACYSTSAIEVGTSAFYVGGGGTAEAGCH
jgi:hypothetical protein